MSTTGTSTTIRPGALTQLLADLVRAPEGAGWDVPLQPGESVGRFEVVREIGRGGFGVVYEARDAELGRSVALKAIRPTAGSTTDTIRLAEAEAAGRLAHPNIVHLYDVGRCERGAYLIMELLHGQQLSDWGATAVPVRDAVRVGVEVSRGLAYAHAQGVVHRDLKPANVFVCDDGQVKVLDFGLAHVFGRAAVEGGTPAYMAPEQRKGEVGDERSDVYSLGVMLHQLLTGALPGSPAATRQTQGQRKPGALSRLVARTLAEDPAQRPTSAAEVHQQLAAIQRSLQPKPLLWGAWAVAVIAIVAAVGLGLRARPLPPGRLLVAMTDTENTSGDGDLDDLSGLLGSALEQSRRLSLMARSRVLGMLRESGRPAPGRLDEPVVRQAALTASANVLLMPAVRRVGEAFEIEVRGIDLARNEPLFTIRERAGGKVGVPEALDRASDRVRTELREERSGTGTLQIRLAAAVPSDPEAWHLYAEALRLDSEGRYREAGARYERALEIDPGFPQAHLKLAARSQFFDDEAWQRHLEAALRHADRLLPKDRVLLQASQLLGEARYDDAMAAWDKAIAGWPQDPEAYRRAGFTALMWFSDTAAARPYLEKAIELSALEDGEAIEALLSLGRTDEALQRARRWSEADHGVGPLAVLSLVYRIRGEPREAIEAARRVVSLGWLPGLPEFGDRRAQKAFWSYLEADAVDEVEALYRRARVESLELLALRGRMRAALRLADAEEEGSRGGARLADGSTPRRALHHALRASLVWGLDDADALWREVQTQLQLGSSAALCWSHSLAALGDVDHARRLAGLLAGFSSSKAYCSRLYRHVRDWKRGDREDAARGLAQMYGPEPAYQLGMVLAELGRHGDAVEAFRRFRRAPEWNFAGANLIAYPRSLYFEAVSLERLGERAEAAKVLGRLLHLWEHADPDLPLLAPARALAAHLAEGG